MPSPSNPRDFISPGHPNAAVVMRTFVTKWVTENTTPLQLSLIKGCGWSPRSLQHTIDAVEQTPIAVEANQSEQIMAKHFSEALIQERNADLVLAERFFSGSVERLNALNDEISKRRLTRMGRGGWAKATKRAISEYDATFKSNDWQQSVDLVTENGLHFTDTKDEARFAYTARSLVIGAKDLIRARVEHQLSAVTDRGGALWDFNAREASQAVGRTINTHIQTIESAQERVAEAWKSLDRVQQLREGLDLQAERVANMTNALQALAWGWDQAFATISDIEAALAEQGIVGSRDSIVEQVLEETVGRNLENTLVD